MTPDYSRTRRACYFSYIAAAPIFCLPAMLFVTFQQMYDIPYTLLGALVALNFCTQLGVDLLFSFFPQHFNVKLTIRTMPLLTSLGLLIYALIPTLWPSHAYAGLLAGTLLFSIASGLGEALISPTIAALPSDNPDRDMSKLHSLYGWGVFGSVVVTTAFFYLFGTQHWMYLTLLFAILPLISSLLYCISPIPELGSSHGSEASAVTKRRRVGILLCVCCIFLGSAAENTMTNWISSYMEISLGIPKTFCDIVGLALFALLLAGVRSVYAKWGKSIWRVMMFGMIGAAVCYFVAGVTPNAGVALAACVLTGCCTSMLWPGTLILMEENMPRLGVAAYALMAAGGDFGASVAPALMGVITDAVKASDWGLHMTQTLGLASSDQLGMKVGMLASVAFPVLGAGLLLIMRRYFKQKTE